jgi:V8-like Glu-specific endopeptidase
MRSESIVYAMRAVALAALGAVVIACGAEGVDDFADDEVVIDATQEELLVNNDDDRSRVTQAQATSYPWRAVAAIRLTSSITTSSCSAFKVGPRHLLSAAHCFYEAHSSGMASLKVALTSFRLVYGQYGSGNAASNMPVNGHKVTIEQLYVPPGYISSNATNASDDWALIRVADSESLPGWFRTKAFTNAEIPGLPEPRAAGFPLPTQTCAASPLTNGQCGGYQYHAPLAENGGIGVSASFLDTQADWTRGQSGGPVFAKVSGQADPDQRWAMGIVHGSGTANSFARRITSVISRKVCDQIAAFPSTSYPSVACTP